MRTLALLILPSLLLFAFACSSSPPKEEIAAVEGAISQFNKALAAGDESTLKNITSPSFTYEAPDKTQDLSSWLRSLRDQLALGRITRTPSDFKTKIDGDIAETNYRISGEVRTEHGSMPLSGSESAKLERSGKSWRIVRISMTR
jgi:Domain of unknown function (DUF4440)